MAAALALLLLAGCGGGPVAPEWQSLSHDHLQKFRQQYLAGDVRGAQRSFERARSVTAATGDPALVAHVELYRCALGVAALDYDACREYEALQPDAGPADRAYGAFVLGVQPPAGAAALPAPYGEVAAAHDGPARDKALADIADALSRLVAAGALMRKSQVTPRGLATAIDAASSQGWRRPLLAWLEVQAKQAEAAGDASAVAAIRKRIDLVYGSMPGTKP